MSPPGPSYSPTAVAEALEMAAAALGAKNAALEDLQERLRLASLQAEQHAGHAVAELAGASKSAGAPPTAGDSTQQPAAAAAAAELAALRQQLAAAEARLAVERQQRLAAKTQLEVVKGQLADALAAQGRAVADLGEVECAVMELRAENQQLRCTLTQRESAYLTLLETVQELFTQHSPASSSGVVSPAKGSEAGEGEQEWEDVGARLQLKLREWQQRLERAAHLSSAERGAADGASAAAWALGSAAGFGSSQQQPAAPGSPASSDGSVCSEDAVSACSSPLACSGASSPASGVAAETAGREGSPVSPRIPAARPLEPAMAAAVAGRPAAGGTPGKGLAGSRIKALGMQAALPAAQKPAAAAAQEPRQA